MMWAEQSTLNTMTTTNQSSLNWFLIQTAPHHTRLAGWHATMTSSELIGMDMNSFNTSQDVAVILDQKYLNHFKGAAPVLRPSLAYHSQQQPHSSLSLLNISKFPPSPGLFYLMGRHSADLMYDATTTTSHCCQPTLFVRELPRNL